MVPSLGSYIILAFPVLSFSINSSIRSSSERSESNPPRVAYSSKTPRSASGDSSRKGISNIRPDFHEKEIAACIANLETMTRAQILWMQSWIALAGAVLWYLPPAPTHSSYVVSLSLAWALFCLVAIWVEGLETWAHRFSAFFGFLLCTIEGILGLLGLTDRPVLLLIMAMLHGCTFFLSVVGRYLSRTLSLFSS